MTDYYVFEDKEHPGNWRVEVIDNEGTCFGAIFFGRGAEKRARAYAALAFYVSDGKQQDHKTE